MNYFSKKDIETIRASDLFDAEWYLENYPDVKMLRMEPAEHYLSIGAKLKRKPSSKFDTVSYLKANPDVEKTGINPLLHYEKWGKKEGRNLSLKTTVISEPQHRDDSSMNVCQDAKITSIQPYSTIGNHKIEEEKQVVPQFKEFARKITSKITANFSRQYEVIKNEFDLPYYLYRYPDIANAVNIDPIKHYIEHGAGEGRDPSPEFCTKYYVARYPDVKENNINPFYHYLAFGRAEGRGATPFSTGDPAFESMCQILGYSSNNVEQTLNERRRDLRNRLESGVLGQMIAKATKLEPLIAHSWREVFTAKLPPFHSEPVVAKLVAMHWLHEAAEFRRARAVVVIPHCRISGASRVAGHLATALSEIYSPEEIVILRTDLSILQFPEWFPENCRHIDFASLSKKLNSQDRKLILMEFLRSLRPDIVFNINSRLFWDTMKPYGKVLAASTALYTYFFCNDKNVYGHWNGYPIQYFCRYFDLFNRVITDSHTLANEFREKYLVPPEQSHKVVTLETPLREPPALVMPKETSINRQPRIYWAGRFDRQKRVDIVFALAKHIPEAKFHLWGEPVLDNYASKLEKPDNVVLEGTYKDLSELSLEQCDLWLYTSEWDGVPNILIDIAATGIPLVGSLVGGTGEIFVEGLSERVTDIGDVASYEAAIRYVLNNPTSARQRAIRLRDYILSRRTLTVYRSDLEAILLTDLEK